MDKIIKELKEKIIRKGKDIEELKSNMKKFQVDVTDEEYNDINEMIKKWKVEGKIDLFFSAIAFLDFVVDEVIKGGTVAIIDKECKNYREINIPVFKKIREKS